MDCKLFRRAAGADPNHLSAEAIAHRDSCAECTRYAREMSSMNGLIERALKIDVPESVNRLGANPNVAPLPVSKPRKSMRWYALAASLAGAIAIGIGVTTFGIPSASIAKDVVQHLGHEPEALVTTDVRVNSQTLEAALAAKGLALAAPLSDVSYVRSCPIRLHLVPHLIVQTANEPVTVLLMTEEKVSETQAFADGNYRGILLPTKKGAVAVIATDAAVAEQVANRVVAAIKWE